jgi:hypothetical protein
LLLQVTRGQAAPQLLSGSNSIAPDVVAPPRSDEAGKTSSTEPSLDARKDAVLKNQVQILAQQPSTPTTGEQPTETTPPVDTVVTPTTPTTPAEPVALKQVTWGRWAAVANHAADSSVSLEGSERIGLNDYYVLFRSKTGSNYAVRKKAA